MKGSHVAGSAGYGGLEACLETRKGLGERGGRDAGRVLSREIHISRRELRVGRSAVVEIKAIPCLPHWRKQAWTPPQSETLRTHANTLLGNREIPRPSAMRWEASAAERIEGPQGVQR